MLTAAVTVASIQCNGRRNSRGRPIQLLLCVRSLPPTPTLYPLPRSLHSTTPPTPRRPVPHPSPPCIWQRAIGVVVHFHCRKSAEELQLRESNWASQFHKDKFRKLDEVSRRWRRLA